MAYDVYWTGYDFTMDIEALEALGIPKVRVNLFFSPSFYYNMYCQAKGKGWYPQPSSPSIVCIELESLIFFVVRHLWNRKQNKAFTLLPQRELDFPDMFVTRLIQTFFAFTE